MKLSGSKTQIAHFNIVLYLQSKNKFEYNINFEGKTIEISESVKTLGIHVDCYLKWTSFLLTLGPTEKLSSACFQMRVLREILDFFQDLKMMIY